MEKICDWLWKPSAQEARRCDSFWWNADDGRVYIKRGEVVSGEYYSGAWMLEKLGLKEYGQLMPNMKKAFDFLNSRIGG
jgi:hypothetical protein